MKRIWFLVILILLPVFVFANADWPDSLKVKVQNSLKARARTVIASCPERIQRLEIPADWGKASLAPLRPSSYLPDCYVAREIVKKTKELLKYVMELKLKPATLNMVHPYNSLHSELEKNIRHLEWEKPFGGSEIKQLLSDMYYVLGYMAYRDAGGDLSKSGHEMAMYFEAANFNYPISAYLISLGTVAYNLKKDFGISSENIPAAK